MTKYKAYIWTDDHRVRLTKIKPNWKANTANLSEPKRLIDLDSPDWRLTKKKLLMNDRPNIYLTTGGQIRELGMTKEVPDAEGFAGEVLSEDMLRDFRQLVRETEDMTKTGYHKFLEVGSVVLVCVLALAAVIVVTILFGGEMTERSTELAGAFKDNWLMNRTSTFLGG